MPEKGDILYCSWGSRRESDRGNQNMIAPKPVELAPRIGIPKRAFVGWGEAWDEAGRQRSYQDQSPPSKDCSKWSPALHLHQLGVKIKIWAFRQCQINSWLTITLLTFGGNKLKKLNITGWKCWHIGHSARMMKNYCQSALEIQSGVVSRKNLFTNPSPRLTGIEEPVDFVIA